MYIQHTIELFFGGGGGRPGAQWFPEIYRPKDIEIIYVETNKLHERGWDPPSHAGRRAARVCLNFRLHAAASLVAALLPLHTTFTI